ncbi:MAG: LamG domain-containing protein [Chloroflexota bacterium]
MAKQPTFYWQFNEQQGSITTDSISDAQGQLNDVLLKGFGRIGPAITLPSIDSHVQFDSGIAQFGTNDFTIAFGMNNINYHDQNLLDIIGNRSNNSNWFSLRLRQKAQLQFEVAGGDHHIHALTGNILKKGSWLHVAIVREGSKLRIYLDGVLQAEATSETGIANINNGLSLRLGHYQENTANALYEDLRIYHTALNKIQIQNLIPPPNRILRSGQIELIPPVGDSFILSKSEPNLSRFSSEFNGLRLGPNTGATLYVGSAFKGTFQKLYANVPDIISTKINDFPKSVHVWSTVGDPFLGRWFIKAPNGQNLSSQSHRLRTSRTHTIDEQFTFQYQPNSDQLFLIPATSREMASLRIGNEASLLVVDDSEQHEDAFSIIHPISKKWLELKSNDSFRWTSQRTERAIFHRGIKLASNEGDVGELKAGEVALYEVRAYRGKTWILSDSEHSASGNFTSLQNFSGLDNQVSSIRLGPHTGVTIFANPLELNKVPPGLANQELEIEDLIDNVPRMADTQLGNNNISRIKIFRTAAAETIFTSVTSKLSQDYRMVDNELEEFSSYRTILRLASNIQEIEVSATDLTTIEVNDDLFQISEVRAVTLRPNLLNQIMITSEANGISTPALKFRTGNMPENQFVVIFPDRSAHQQIAELEDNALWSATDAQGNLIVDQTKHTRSEIASVQNTIKRTMATIVTIDDEEDVPSSDVKTVNGLGRVVSKTQVVSNDMIDSPWTLHFEPRSTDTRGLISDDSAGLVLDTPKIWEEPIDQNRFEQLITQSQASNGLSASRSINPDSGLSAPNISRLGIIDDITGVFDDVRDGLGDFVDGVKEGFDITVGFLDDTLNVIIEVGGQVFRFVADTVKKVADFVTAVIEQVVESIEQFIEFLRFLFAWDDILETKRFLVQTINNAFDSATGMVESAKEPVIEFFDSLQEGLEDGFERVIDLIGVDPEETEENGFELPEEAEWFLNKLIGSRGNNITQGINELVTEALEDILADLAQLNLPSIVETFLRLLEQIQELPQIGNRIRDEVLVEVIETLIANPLRPEVAFISILEALRTVISDLLVIGEDIALVFLDLVAEAIQSIKDLLNQEIPIPFIASLFKLIGGGDLTILNVTAMLVAIPTTIVSKLVFDEAPFKGISQPAFPDTLAGSRLSRANEQTAVAGDEIDLDEQRRKVRGFGILAICADAVDGLITASLDFTSEPFEQKNPDSIQSRAEVMSLILRCFSWLGTFPPSRVEAGGYPYNMLLNENTVSKSNDEAEYWERVMWSWRTAILGFDITYMSVVSIATSPKFEQQMKTFKGYFPVQRLRRANNHTIFLVVALAVVDLGLTGRFLHTLSSDRRTIESINEVHRIMPLTLCWLRMTVDPSALLFLLGTNLSSTAITTVLSSVILDKNIKELS